MANINFRSVNQLLRTDPEINQMIQFINGNRRQFPIGVPNLQRYLAKSNNFIVQNGDLFYTYNNGQQIEFVRKADINNRLTALYNNKDTGLGKSIQTFYYLVIHTYLNITRKEVVNFLKSQQIYNMSRPLKPAMPYALQTYKQPKQAYAMDYIHVPKYTLRGQREKYIFVVVDCFSKYVFLFATADNTDATTIRCLNQIIQAGQSPRIVIADNGFQNAIKNFLQQHNIKIQNNPSHIPVKQVEAMNRTIRRYLRELILRNYQNANLHFVWAQEMRTIQDAINSTKSSVTKKTPNELFNDPNQQIANPTFQEIVRDVNQKKEDKIRPHLNDQLFTVNQPVHLLLTSVYRDMRKVKKDCKEMKNMVALWTPEIYYIDRIFHARNRHGLPLYSVRNANGQTLRNDVYHHNPQLQVKKLKATDLLDATFEVNQNPIYNNRDAIAMNRIPNHHRQPILIQFNSIA